MRYIAVLLQVAFIGLVVAQCPHNLGATSIGTPSGDYTLPASQIMYDIGGTYNALDSITIPSGGELIFDNANMNLNLNYIRVESGGKITMGSGANGCQITNNIVITFEGGYNNANPGPIGLDPADGVNLGAKGLGVLSGAEVHMYGAAPEFTWTFLSTTADAGATSITVQDDITGWSVGDEIVIATTDFGEVLDYANFPDCLPTVSTCTQEPEGSVGYIRGREFPDQSEVRTISGINGNTISFTTPLEYMHWADEYSFGEVGLLTRNIVLQGDGDLAATDGFGGHMIVRVVNDAHIEGVQFKNMGQSGELGRYPLHFHLLKEQSVGFQVLKNSFYDCFQRSFVIHDSNGIEVEWNVAYKTHGSMYFLEDGSEINNVFNKNLGITALPVASSSDHLIIPSDNEPSIFWIPNPANDFTANSAVNSKFGFWYVMPETPNGASAGDYPAATTEMRPRLLPLGAFNDNIGHSCGHTGIFIDDMQNQDGTVDLASYTPRVGPYVGVASYLLEEIDAVFYRNHAYKNRRHGLWARGGPLHFTDSVFVDNMFGYNAPPGATFLSNSVIVGETGNVGTVPEGETYTRTRPSQWRGESRLIGIETYDNGGPQYAQDIEFINFETRPERPAGCLSVLDARFILHTRNRYAGFTMTNANPVWFPDSGRDGPIGSALLDVDGSVTGHAGGAWIVSDNDLLAFREDCVDMVDEWNTYYCPPHRQPYVQIVMRANPLPSGSTSNTFFTDESQVVERGQWHHMGSSRMMGSMGEYDGGEFQFMMNMPSRSAYTFRWGNDSTAGQVHQGYSWGNGLKIYLTSAAPGDWIVFAIPYPTSGASITVTRAQWSGSDEPVTAVDSWAELNSETYYHNQNNGHLYLFLENTEYNSYDNDFDTFTDWQERDGWEYTITTNCPGGRCDVSGWMNVPGSPIDQLQIQEDKYTAVACDDLSEAIGNTNGFFYFNDERLTMDAIVYHDQHGDLTDAKIVDTGRATDRIIGQFVGSLSSPLRLTFDISHTTWENLVAGDVKLVLERSSGPDYIASVLCDESFGPCIPPRAIPDVDMNTVCDDITGEISIFNDGPFLSWPEMQMYTWPPSWSNFDATDTAVVLCGINSLWARMNRTTSFTIAYPDSDQTVDHMITAGDGAGEIRWLEVWVRYESAVDDTVNFGFRLEDRVEEHAAYYTDSSNYLDYAIESGTWTRIRVNINDLGVNDGSTVEFENLQVFMPYTYETMNDRDIYFDRIRFVPATNEPMTTVMDADDIKAAQDCGATVDPDPTDGTDGGDGSGATDTDTDGDENAGATLSHWL